jgi:hypothetical protein
MKIILQWIVERYHFQKFIPLAMILNFAVEFPSESFNSLEFIMRFIFICYALLIFRIWDDIESVKYDKLNHPERLLCKQKNLRSVRCITYLSLTIPLMVSFFYTPNKNFIPIWCILCIFYVFFYILKKFLINDNIILNHIGLIKYPVFVLLLSFDEKFLRVNLISSLIVVSLFMMIYEIVHEPKYKTKKFYKSLLGCEIIIFVCLMIYSINLYMLGDALF